MRKAQPCPTLEEAQICLESQGGFLEEMVESRGAGLPGGGGGESGGLPGGSGGESGGASWRR